MVGVLAIGVDIWGMFLQYLSFSRQRGNRRWELMEGGAETCRSCLPREQRW
jgi:hypothetical protein